MIAVDWDLASEVIFQDHDILHLFDIDKDGLEDPASEYNRATGFGDHRSQAWFRAFLNVKLRQYSDSSSSRRLRPRLATNTPFMIKVCCDKY